MARPLPREFGLPEPSGGPARARSRPLLHTSMFVTGLRFALPHPALSDVHVLDAEGRRVRTLACGELAAGEHEYGWDGLDEVGERCPPGRYALRLETGGRLLTSRVVSIA